MPYPSVDLHQPFQQAINNSFRKFSDQEIERNLRQNIEQDMLREYDFIIYECYILLNIIYSDPNNSFTRDSTNVYFTYNGTNLTNKIDILNEIETGLSTVMPRPVEIVLDTKTIVMKRRSDPHKIYLPLFLINTRIEPALVFDIYDNIKNKDYSFNLFTYTHFLLERLSDHLSINEQELEYVYEYSFKYVPLNKKDYSIELTNKYFIKLFLQVLTHNDNSDYIEEWITYFFKTLRRVRSNLVLIGNKDVAEEIFYNGIIKQIFGFEYCITITEEMLENQSIDSIVHNKLFIHINHIPEKEENQKKLKDLLEGIIVHDSVGSNYGTVPFLCQIIFTLDQPHPFLSDFLSHSKVFFIDSIENINKKLNQPDRISLLNNIAKNLIDFSHQLASLDFSKVKNHSDQYRFIDLDQQAIMEQRSIHYSNKINLNDTIKFKDTDYKTDNELFKNWLKEPELIKLALFYNSENPILDPYDDSFEKIIPSEDRYKHTYITGKTGSGKSELLKTLIYRDIIRDNCSVILLDIHGDLADSVTRLVQDKERLVLIDPTLEKDLSPTINLFHTDDKSEENVEQVSQMITTIINEINVGDTPSGTMIDILENCIPLLVRSDDKDFYDLKSLMKDVPKLTGTKEEKQAIQQKRNKIESEIDKFSKNKFEEEYFQDEFMDVNNSTRQAVKRRLNKILKDSLFSNLTNGQNKINLQKEMNSSKNKIIIFNIPKSKMLSTYSHYIKFIIGLIQIIALKRADIKDEKKRPHTHLYIDEFHNFITPRIEEILTESRKYKLFLTLAHQSVSQIKDSNLRDIILDNTNVKIVGKNSNKTLDMMNKTLNTKLEDVSKLTAGEFNLQSGNNDVIRIRNTDKLLNGQESISDEQWEEHKQYQIEKHYRSTKKVDVEESQTNREKDEFNENLAKFIALIKKGNPEKFLIGDDLKSEDYEELKHNFEDVDENRCFYIARPKMLTYFEALYGKTDFKDNASFLDELKEKDSLFKQKADHNKTYNAKKRYKICQ
jgi:hypothetical protein